MRLGRVKGEASPIWRRLLLAFAVSLMAASQPVFEVALAQPGTSQPATSGPTLGQQKATEAAPTTVSAETVLLLTRSALLSLNDALQTGNYTVLRDRGAPSFRDRNNAAQLSQVFSSLASRGIDLSATGILTPKMLSTPAVDSNGRLRIKGTFLATPCKSISSWSSRWLAANGTYMR